MADDSRGMESPRWVPRESAHPKSGTQRKTSKGKAVRTAELDSLIPLSYHAYLAKRLDFESKEKTVQNDHNAKEDVKGRMLDQSPRHEMSKNAINPCGPTFKYSDVSWSYVCKQNIGTY